MGFHRAFSVHQYILYDFASKQSRPCADCVDMQADLGLQCLGRGERPFSQGAAQLCQNHANLSCQNAIV